MCEQAARREILLDNPMTKACNELSISERKSACYRCDCREDYFGRWRGVALVQPQPAKEGGEQIVLARRAKQHDGNARAQPRLIRIRRFLDGEKSTGITTG